MNPPKTIVIANQKGGLGKTTVAQNVGYCISQTGRKTLLIDLDPQQNLGKTFNVDTTSSVAEVLSGNSADPVQINSTNLFILPAGPNLSVYLAKMAADIDLLFPLREYVKSLSNYSVIIIDTPPTLVGLTLAGFIAADYLLIPVSTSFYSTHGTDDLIQTYVKVKKQLNTGLNLLGFCVSMHDGRTALGNEILDGLRSQFNGKVFSSTISKTVKIEEAQAKGKSVSELYPQAEVSKQYSALTNEILEVIYG